eukprot:jgi/Botrbrau1/5703/Bobra.0071s0036.1
MKVLSSKLLRGKRPHNSSPASSVVNGSRNSPVPGSSNPSTSFVHSSFESIDLGPLGSINLSHAGYQASDPFQDLHVREVGESHVFAALFSSRHALQAASYLQRHFYKELLRHLKANDGDLPKTFRAALAAVDRGFRHLHPFNSSILDGVQAATVWVDAPSATAYVATVGQCHAVVGHSDVDDAVQVTFDTAQDRAGECATPSFNEARRSSTLNKNNAPEMLFLNSLSAIQLNEGMDTVLIGSSGFWREVYPQKALLRLGFLHNGAPHANNGTAAAHLIYLALDTVVKRTKRQEDPRMRALRSVSSLQSLHVGDISKYKWGGRQPVRRRRGDVHGDMTVMVLCLNSAGPYGEAIPAGSLRGPAKRIRQSLSRGQLVGSADRSGACKRAHRHWDLIRMHFRDFPLASKSFIERRWYELVEAAQLQAQHADRRRVAATAVHNASDTASWREWMQRQSVRKQDFMDSPIISRLFCSASQRGSATSHNPSLQTSSSIGADSDADTPNWRANDINVGVDLEPSLEEDPSEEPTLEQHPHLQGEESDSADEELSVLQGQRASSKSAHPLRTTTYRVISLDRVRAVPAAA